MLHLRAAVRSGVPWRRALVEAMGLWTLPQENHKGRDFCYLIGGEAFDWLTLAERLCEEVADQVNEEEREQLLFFGQLDQEMSQETFRELLGAAKYRAFLNYWYGVVVEEGLQLAVEAAVRKRHRALCYPDSEELVEEVFSHLYGATRRELLQEFRTRSNLLPDADLTLTQLKEFTYWLFKRRVHIWDPARVASDTQRGIQQLKQLGQSLDPAAEFETSPHQ